jgi:hypothetical protein
MRGQVPDQGDQGLARNLAVFLAASVQASSQHRADPGFVTPFTPFLRFRAFRPF